MNIGGSGAGSEICDELESVRKLASVREFESVRELDYVREFTYLGDRVNASRRCEAAVTART